MHGIENINYPFLHSITIILPKMNTDSSIGHTTSENYQTIRTPLVYLLMEILIGETDLHCQHVIKIELQPMSKLLKR